jgi:hypothetical protein
MLASFDDSGKLSEDENAAAAASSLLTSVAGFAALCSRRHEEGNMVKRLPGALHAKFTAASLSLSRLDGDLFHC